VVADSTGARDNRGIPRLPAVQDNGRASLSRSIGESVRMAWRSLLGHRMRAFLSMLGIIIGISSVVSSMAVGEGARQSIMNEIGKLGNTTLEIRPGTGWGSKRPDMERALSLDDIASLGKQSWVLGVSPIVSSMTTAVRQGLIPRLFFPGFPPTISRCRAFVSFTATVLPTAMSTIVNRCWCWMKPAKRRCFPVMKIRWVKLCKSPARRGG
jgi:macrolide transport system ATP-binding/permease protein